MIHHMTHNITRRDLVALGGLGVLATALPSIASAKAAPLTAGEQANIKVVKAFFEASNAQPLDLEKLIHTFFAPDALVRWSEDAPAVKGQAAAIDAMKSMMTPGTTFDIKILDIFAKGPVVVTSRIDTMKVSGKPDMPFNVAGLHVVKDGKITEYTDYLAK